MKITLDEETGDAQVTRGDEIVVKKWHSSNWAGLASLKEPIGGYRVLSVTSSRAPVTPIHRKLSTLSDDGSMIIHLQWNDYRDSSLEKLAKEFAAYQKEWKESEDGITLIGILKSVKLEHSFHGVGKKEKKNRSPLVTNIVAMALGSLHHAESLIPDYHSGYARKAGLQLASIVAFREVLGEPGKPLPCFIQDPAFSALDVQFLTSLGMKVVEDPVAFSHIDADSLVWHKGAVDSIPRRICSGTLPAVMFCDDWSEDDRFCNYRPGEDTAMLSKMFAKYYRANYTEYDEDLFWRKSAFQY